MTYRLLAFLDADDTACRLKEVPLLHLDGMLVSDRALEDVVFTINLTADRSDLVVGIKNPADAPPLMDRTAILAKAREMALGSDILDLPGGGSGIIWNDALIPGEQMCPFDDMPEIV